MSLLGTLRGALALNGGLRFGGKAIGFGAGGIVGCDLRFDSSERLFRFLLPCFALGDESGFLWRHVSELSAG
jgi:hypothetical protein